MARMETLPNEITKMICDNVDPSSLINLRLVNRVFMHWATPRFAVVFFTDLKVFLSYRSLEMLIEICAHPFYRTHIKSIGFGTQRLSTTVMGCKTTHDATSSGDMADYLLNGKPRTAYFGNCLEQDNLARSGDAIYLLTLALQHLPQHGSPVRLGIFDDVWVMQEDGVLGAYSVYDACGFDDFAYWPYWECFRDAAIKTLLSAIDRSNYPLDHLQISYETEVAGDDNSSRDDPHAGAIDLLSGFNFTALTNICQNMRIFELKVSDSYQVLEGDTPASVARLLTLAFNLEVLSLDMGSLSYSDIGHIGNHRGELETFTQPMRTTRLREVHLSNCMVPGNCLVELFERNKSTVKTVAFDNCCMGWSGSWGRLFTRMLELGIQIENLTVSNLYREQSNFGGQGYQVDYVVAGTREFGAPNISEVDAGVSDLQKFVTELVENDL